MSLIKAIEIWKPDFEGILTLESSYYNGLTQFSSISGQTTFRSGEGLPGKAFQAIEPIAMPLTEESGFTRAHEAIKQGLNVGVAIPTMIDGIVQSITVMLFGLDAVPGAIEIWKANGRRINLIDGQYYGCDDFKKASRGRFFAVGQGLPGKAFEAKRGIIFNRLENGRKFVRFREATKAGLAGGLAIPFGNYIIVFLASKQTPLAQAFEVWSLNDEQVLKLDSGFYGKNNDFKNVSEVTTFPIGIGLPGMVYARQSAIIMGDLGKEKAFLRRDSARETGIVAGLGIPITDKGKITSVVIVLI